LNKERLSYIIFHILYVSVAVGFTDLLKSGLRVFVFSVMKVRFCTLFMKTFNQTAAPAGTLHIL
jgi:hypothetical protein